MSASPERPDDGGPGTSRVTTDRLAAFSDAVIAIVVTIMVLELRPPEGDGLAALHDSARTFGAYVLSFLYLSLHWVNFHHLYAASDRLDATIMWTNVHYLFWLSLIPFATAWMGDSGFSPAPTAVYGATLLLAGLAHRLLEWRVRAAAPTGGALDRQLRRDWKGWGSIAGYAVGVIASFWVPPVAVGIYLGIGIAWVVPDRRLRRAMRRGGGRSGGPGPDQSS